jgi:hypothetical protein
LRKRLCASNRGKAGKEPAHPLWKDPATAIAEDRGKAGKKPEHPLPLHLPPEILRKERADYYAAWPAMQIPALDYKTPLRAAKLKNIPSDPLEFT